MAEPDSFPALTNDHPIAIRPEDLSPTAKELPPAYTPESWSRLRHWHSLEVTATALYCVVWVDADEYGPIRLIRMTHQGEYVSHIDLRLIKGFHWPHWISILDDYICVATLHRNDLTDNDVQTYYLFTHLGYRIAVWQSGDDASTASDFAGGVIRADFLRPNGRWGECLYRITPIVLGKSGPSRTTYDHEITTWTIADVIVSLNDAVDRGLSEIRSLVSECSRTYHFRYPSSIEQADDTGTRTVTGWHNVRSDTSSLWLCEENWGWSPGETATSRRQGESIELPDLRYLRFQPGFWRYFEQVEEVSYGPSAHVSEGLWVTCARLLEDNNKLALMAFRLEEGIGVLQALAVPFSSADTSGWPNDLLAIDIRGMLGYKALVSIGSSPYTFDTILGDFEPFELMVPTYLT